MRASNSITRIADYYSRHGLVDTARRVALQAKRAVFSGRMVVFYCDMGKQAPCPNLPSTLLLQRIQNFAELSAADLQQMTSFWNPQQSLRNIQERFDKRASLWLIRSGERIAGYGWTLQGCAIEPYYFPLGPDDVHLFDFHVFPEHRGRGFNPLLIKHILASVADETEGRAFIEAAEWNWAQLASLKKTPFRCLGLVRTVTFFGRTFSCWTGGDTLEGSKEPDGKDKNLALSRPH